jgi:probable F420-dependent oxidoreductase
MRIGAVFPQTEIGDDPDVIRTWTSDTPFHEVFVLFGYLAAVTTSVELVTGVLVLPQRQTALVAKQAAEVDVLSGGRLRVGVGVGWNPVEYEALGESFGDRGVRSEEQVELLRELWAKPTTTYTGRWHRVDNAGIRPLPVRRRIPVWFGGNADATLRRVGRLGDGWLPQRGPDETAQSMVERIRSYARQADRNPEEIGFEPRLTVASTPESNWAEFATGWRDLGPPTCVSTPWASGS